MIRVGIAELTPGEVLLVREMCKVFYEGIEPEDIFKDEVRALKQIWREPDKGLIITQIQSWRTGKELQVYGVIGNRLIAACPEIFEEIKAFARSEGCRWISWTAKSKGLFKVYEKKLGAKEHSRTFMMELDNG